MDISDIINIADIADVADITTGIADIITDIADIVTDIAGIADRVLQTLRWKQVGVYKVSWGCPVTINNNRKVKVVVILKGKLKLAKGLLVYLTVIAVFYKILNRLNLNFMTYLLKNSKQLING